MVIPFREGNACWALWMSVHGGGWNEDPISDSLLERRLSPRAPALARTLTQLLIAWVCVPAWSLWQVFGPQGIENIEEGLVFLPLTTVVSISYPPLLSPHSVRRLRHVRPLPDHPP